MTPLPYWLYFHAALFALMAVEYGLLRRVANLHHKALYATLLWTAAALAFAALLAPAFHSRGVTEYIAGYFLEESLSIDNLFVFLLLFRFFRIAEARQPRVLFWGVAGAILLRGSLVFAGVKLLNRFQWVDYVFGALLLIAAIRLLKPEDPRAQGQPPRWIAWLTRLHPISASQDHFFVLEAPAPDSASSAAADPASGAGGSPSSRPRRMATILLIALIAVELADVVFALDSIPAVLSITRQPFLAYTSNMMAVMGLRSLYILLAATLSRLRFLHFGLAGILAFAAIKMLLASRIDISPLLSLAIIAVLLGVTVTASLLAPAKSRTLV